jgi:hypothetical protein
MKDELLNPQPVEHIHIFMFPFPVTFAIIQRLDVEAQPLTPALKGIVLPYES